MNFMEIAKLRAARYLWAKKLRNYLNLRIPDPNVKDTLPNI